jgi:hypothetical protein
LGYCDICLVITAFIINKGTAASVMDYLPLLFSLFSLTVPLLFIGLVLKSWSLILLDLSIIIWIPLLPGILYYRTTEARIPVVRGVYRLFLPKGARYVGIHNLFCHLFFC